MTEAGPSNGVQHATLASLMLASGSVHAHHVDLDDPSSASNRYLQSLTSKSLSDLRGQPAALSEASNSLNTQLSALCTQYVSSFVQVHQATSSLPSSLATLDTVLDDIVNHHLPALSTSSQQFSGKVESSLQAKEKAQNLILQYELSLKDLMDIPKLLMTCVRANHPVEALLLAVHMMKIERKGKFASTIRSLQDECWVHLRRLQDDLLRGLGARGLRLPAAKRIVSLLRKFKEVDEAQEKDATQQQRRRVSMSDSSICISFLCSRWALLEESTSNASSSKSSAILSAQLSTWRDVVGDTCNMAQTLFSSSDNNGTSSEEDELSPTTLIASFSRQALSLLQRLLSESVPSLPEDSINLRDTLETLAALHTQLSYSAASLSRQGLDISRVVSGHSIFYQQVTDMWTKAMQDAREEFDKARRVRKTSNSLTWIERDTAKKLLGEPLDALNSPDRLGEVLKQFPDLRLLANHILDSYNALLSFAPLEAAKGVAHALDDALSGVCGQLFEQMKDSEVVEIDLPLDPIMSTNAGSRYYEKDATRLSQANLALLARMMSILCGPLANHLRSLIRELFGRDATPTGAGQSLDAQVGEIAQWCEGMEQAWLEGERLRQERVRKEEEELAAEELKKKQEEEERLAELERRRVEEAKKREAEEAERQRIVEKERAEEEERLRIKAEEEERKREAEKLKEKEEERLQAEEAKRKAEEEEAAKKLQEEEAKRREEAEAKEREAAAAAKEKEEAAAAKEREAAAAEEKEREAAASREREEKLRKEKEQREREAEQKAKDAEREKQKADEETSRKREEEAVVEPAVEKLEEEEEGAQGLEKDEHSTEVLLAKPDETKKDIGDAKDTPVETAAEKTPSGDAQTGADRAPIDHAAGPISADLSAPAEIITSVQNDTTGAVAAASTGDKEEGGLATSAPTQAEEAPPATTSTEAGIVTPATTEKESDLSRKASTSTNKLAEKLRQRQEQRQKKAGGA